MPTELRNLDSPLLEMALSTPDALERELGVSLGDHRDLVLEVARQTKTFMGKRFTDAPWYGYVALDRELGLVVGTCSFKGPPDAAGLVEIAYFTFPPFENRGYATAMAQHLLDIAAATKRVLAICAHTMPERNASNRVLEKLGFRLEGEREDPEDGPVWRWMREVTPAAG